MYNYNAHFICIAVRGNHTQYGKICIYAETLCLPHLLLLRNCIHSGHSANGVLLNAFLLLVISKFTRRLIESLELYRDTKLYHDYRQLRNVYFTNTRCATALFYE